MPLYPQNEVSERATLHMAKTLPVTNQTSFSMKKPAIPGLLLKELQHRATERASSRICVPRRAAEEDEEEGEDERIGALWSRKINRTTRTRFQPWLLISGLRNDLFPHMSSCDYASPAVIFQCSARLPQLVASTLRVSFRRGGGGGKKSEKERQKK